MSCQSGAVGRRENFGSLQRFDSRIGQFGYSDPITMNTIPEVEDAVWRVEKLFLTPFLAFLALTPFIGSDVLYALGGSGRVS